MKNTVGMMLWRKRWSCIEESEMEIGKTKDREKWVDYVKVIACVLVVLGHFFQSMVKATDNTR